MNQIQINNLKIRLKGGRYLVYNPDGQCLEDFDRLSDAKAWCGGVLDFVTKKPRGWVFCKEGTKKEIGFSEPEAGRNAENEMHDFSQGYANHFEVYFRDSKGVLHSVDAEALPEDFA
jgi:hypothetical protein